jgi:hypothetical protein
MTLTAWLNSMPLMNWFLALVALLVIVAVPGIIAEEAVDMLKRYRFPMWRYLLACAVLVLLAFIAVLLWAGSAIAGV